MTVNICLSLQISVSLPTQTPVLVPLLLGEELANYEIVGGIVLSVLIIILGKFIYAPIV